MISRFLIILFLFFSSKLAFGEAPAYLFIENKGQWPQEVLYRAQIPNGYLWVTDKGLKYQLFDLKNAQAHTSSLDAHLRKKQLTEQTLFAAFKNTAASSSEFKNNKSIQYFNFFYGNDPDLWQSGVPSFDQIRLSNVFDGIDFRMYSVDQTLKYEYIVKPGADASQIRFSYHGADGVETKDGQLIIKTQVGIIKEYAPYTFQQQKNARKKIDSYFKLIDNEISFSIGDYDHSKELIIDPELVFSTYTGAFSDNWAHTSTFDSKGNLYAGGTIFGVNYPVSFGVFQPKASGVSGDINGGSRTDIVITKYAADGKNILYSTFLGGQESEVPHSLIVNSKDQLVVFGTTSSSNFPVSSTAFDRTFNGGVTLDGPPVSTNILYSSGSDIFISLIEENGSKLLASTFLGGSDNDGIHDYRALAIKNYGDEFRGEVVVDEANNIYVASVSKSTNFPVKDAFQVKKSVYDGIISKFNPDLSSLLFSSFLGGNDYDAAYGLRVDKKGAIFVLGTTISKDILGSAQGLNKSLQGESDAFVVKIENSKLVAGTYLGTSRSEIGSLMDLDESGNVYVYGLSSGSYPVSAGVYTNAKSGQFIQTLNNSLSSSVFSTVIGSGSGAVDLVPTAFMVNKCNNIYLAGWGGNVNSKNGFNAKSTTKGLPITENAFRKTTTGSNYYFAILEKNAKSLLFGTYFGSEAPSNPNDERGDHLDGGTCRFDKNGVIYHTACVCKSSGGFVQFPIKNAAQAAHNSTNCNMAAFKFDLDAILAKFDIKNGGILNPIELCAPAKLELENKSLGAEEYEWFLDDKKISTTKNIDYTIDKAGNYTIKLKIRNKLTCKEVDSTSRQIIAKSFDFSVSKDTLVCPNGVVKLFATGGKSYLWSPANLFTNPTSSKVEFKPNTSVNVNVKITNEECSIIKNISVKAENNKPDFISSPSKTICLGDSLKLEVSGSANSFKWSGPGVSDSTKTSITVKPIKTSAYTVTGVYADGCKPTNIINVNIEEAVKLNFDVEYLFDCNTRAKIKIINKSENGDTFRWRSEGFFDKTGTNPDAFVLEAPKNIIVNLESKSKVGCIYTLNKSLDLKNYDGLIPNVITPNSDKKNDTFVVGYPPSYLEIYNSHGKNVLKTENYLNDWGTKAETGTYYYVLRIPNGLVCKGWIEVLK